MAIPPQPSGCWHYTHVTPFLVTAHTNKQISNYTSQEGSHYVAINWFCPAEGTNETGLYRKERAATILQVLWTLVNVSVPFTSAQKP